MQKTRSRLLIIMCLLFCFKAVISCKSEGENKIENPITAEDLSNALKNNTKNKLFKADELSEFYQARNYAPAWNNKSTRNTLYKALKNAGGEGLSFSDYHGKKIQKLLQNKENLNTAERAVLEVLLTDAFFKYSDHLFYGKLEPKDLHEIWGVHRKNINLVNLLREALQNQEIEGTLEGLKPQNNIYSGLKKSLKEYRKMAKQEEGFPKIGEGIAIKPGEKDERIPVVVARLKQLGLLNENYVSRENIYDEEIQAAVKKFQNQKDLTGDAILGNSTIAELNKDAEMRYNQILANLERWRWYPRDLGEHYILINIPNYKLAVVKNGDTLKTHNVIAGAKTSQTPVFSDTIQYIVINPEWHIPISIRNKEIIPMASKNPNYLENQNIYITGPDGNRIEPSSINWSGDAVKTYTFVQGAGPLNSLGRVKIIYPNPYLIYLHDTPAKWIFNQNARAASHGCVRVENAIELAAYVVGNRMEWNLEKIQEVILEGKTKQVEVTQPIQVHHFYWTAWRENGETVFSNDIYGLDEGICTALENE